MFQTLRRKKIYIGPEDHGKRMSLDDFDEAIGQEGHLYELNKGIIEVSNVPKIQHGRMVAEFRKQMIIYDARYPGVISYMSAGSDAKLLIGPSESERHPDWIVYLQPEPKSKDIWSLWIPEIVIEVVSESSKKRDYEDKPEEYLQFGVDEYWIVDPLKMQMTAMTRWRGEWKPAVIKPTKKYTTHLLPGFSLDLKRVLNAGM